MGRKQLRSRPFGFTLIELLITMSIAIILIAVALPLVKFSLEEGKTREASRILNGFLARAKAQAAFAQRPIGVMIMRDPVDNTRATQCFLAEIPPPFGGALLGATVTVNSSSGVLTFDGTSGSMLNLLFPESAGFGIRLDYKGDVYTGFATVSSGTASLTITDPRFFALVSQQSFDFSRSYTYQVYRLPQKLANVELELPKGTFISLANSGTGAAGTEFSAATTDKITVMFAPSGAMSSIDSTGTSVVPSGTVHFLVARLRNETTPPPILNDSNNYWVSIGHLTGTIATSETGFDGAFVGAVSTMDSNVTVAESRFYAIRYDQSGGR